MKLARSLKIVSSLYPDCNITSAATAAMTNVRMAMVSLISIRDFTKPQPIQNRPRLNIGSANMRFHQSNSAGKANTSRRPSSGRFAQYVGDLALGAAAA